jgi:hypothetical protein
LSSSVTDGNFKDSGNTNNMHVLFKLFISDTGVMCFTFVVYNSCHVDGSSTSSHDSKKFRTRSMEEQGGMAFGFRKTATAVCKTGVIDNSCRP